MRARAKVDVLERRLSEIRKNLGQLYSFSSRDGRQEPFQAFIIDAWSSPRCFISNSPRCTHVHYHESNGKARHVDFCLSDMVIVKTQSARSIPNMSPIFSNSKTLGRIKIRFESRAFLSDETTLGFNRVLVDHVTKSLLRVCDGDKFKFFGMTEMISTSNLQVHTDKLDIIPFPSGSKVGSCFVQCLKVTFMVELSLSGGTTVSFKDAANLHKIMRVLCPALPRATDMFIGPVGNKNTLIEI